MTKYECYQDGECVGSKESRTKIECAVVSLTQEGATVVSWAKNSVAAQKFITGKKGKSFVKAGAALSVVDVVCGSAEKNEPEPEFVKKVDSESSLPAQGAVSGLSGELESAKNDDVVHKDITYRGVDYKIVYDPKTGSTTVDNVIFKSPSAAANELTGRHVNGRKFFGLPSRSPGGKRSRDPAIRLQRDIAHAEARVQSRRLRLASVEVKLEKARAELESATDVLNAARAKNGVDQPAEGAV